jgi:vacuolar-type H+-ATPase subunit I/STV1
LPDHGSRRVPRILIALHGLIILLLAPIVLWTVNTEAKNDNRVACLSCLGLVLTFVAALVGILVWQLAGGSRTPRVRAAGFEEYFKHHNREP